MKDETSKLDAWTRAELQAPTVEREARSLLVRRAKGDGMDGIDAKLAEAAALRCVASRLLEQALTDAKIAAEAVHYRNVTTPTIRSFASWDRQFMSDVDVSEPQGALPASPRESTLPAHRMEKSRTPGGKA